jgi:hypothetical protein
MYFKRLLSYMNDFGRPKKAGIQQSYQPMRLDDSTDWQSREIYRYSYNRYIFIFANERR